MCRRGFLKYLYEQLIIALIPTKKLDNSIFNFNEESRKFKVIDHISFHFVTTHCPCGDASIFPLNFINEIVKENEKKLENEEEIGYILSNFTGAKLIKKKSKDSMIQSLGEIRTKPGRGEPTLSISCSDKLAKWNVLGLQGSLLHSFLEEPINFQSLTFCDTDYCNIDATKRAVWKRFEHIKLDLPPSFRYK